MPAAAPPCPTCSARHAAAVRRHQPGLLTVAVQAHFGRRGNRLYPALYRAGIVDHLIDASTGFAAEDRALLLARGIGITNLVAGATARAAELTPAELVAGAANLERTVARVRPVVLAVLGITAYRTAFDRPKARVGQPDGIAGAQLWVVPNPQRPERPRLLTTSPPRTARPPWPPGSSARTATSVLGH